MNRECEVTFEYAVDINNVDKAMEIEEQLESKLEEVHKRTSDDMFPSFDVSLEKMEKDEDGDYAIFNITYSYEEDYTYEEGYESCDWYEPDVPDEIITKDEDEVIDFMEETIETAFKELGVDTIDNNIIENNIDSIETLFSKVQDAKESAREDYDYDR